MAQRAAPTADRATARPRTLQVVGTAALLLAAGLFAYWGTWHNHFLFDDYPAIDDNLALRSGDWWTAAFGARHTPLANRPLTCLSLVVDLALFGEGPFGPHLTNLLLQSASRSDASAPRRRGTRSRVTCPTN